MDQEGPTEYFGAWRNLLRVFAEVYCRRAMNRKVLLMERDTYYIPTSNIDRTIHALFPRTTAHILPNTSVQSLHTASVLTKITFFYPLPWRRRPNRTTHNVKMLIRQEELKIRRKEVALTEK